MQEETLKRLKAPTNLARILNGYMEALTLIDIFCMPQESMNEYVRLAREWANPVLRTEPVSKAATRLFTHRVERFFMLHVLNTSFHDWHRHLVDAIELLEKFFAEYDGDLKRYAIERRISIIDEDGSNDESDWEKDGFDAEGAQLWKVAYKDDAETLAEYSLASELAFHFVGDDEHGERIGTSHAADYALFTEIVRTEADRNPLDTMGQFLGAELPQYQFDAQGQLTPMSDGDKIEAKINEGITNARIIAWFELALHEANQAVFLQTFATTSEHYRELLAQLIRVRDLDFPEPEAHLVVA